MSFPTSLDNLDATSPLASDNLGTGPHSSLHDQERTAVDAIEAKIGIDSSAVTTSHDYKLSGVTGTDKAVSKTGTETLTNKTLTSPAINTPTITTPTIRDWDGWVDANETWTYASATTFTISADKTSKYSIGDKVRFQNNDSGTYLYAYIVNVAYSAPNTTVTVVGNAVPNATITDNYYSKVDTPVNFPRSFSYTPTFTGFSTDPSSLASNFIIRGNVLIWHFGASVVGTSNATTFTISAPVASYVNFWSLILVHDNGSWQTLPGTISAAAGGTTFSLYKTIITGIWTSSGEKSAHFTISYII